MKILIQKVYFADVISPSNLSGKVCSHLTAYEGVEYEEVQPRTTLNRFDKLFSLRVNSEE